MRSFANLLKSLGYVCIAFFISKTDRLLWRCGGRLIPLDRLPCCGDMLGVWDSGTLGNCALAARKLPVRGNFDLKVGNSFRLTLAKSLHQEKGRQLIYLSRLFRLIPCHLDASKMSKHGLGLYNVNN